MEDKKGVNEKKDNINNENWNSNWIFREGFNNEDYDDGRNLYGIRGKGKNGRIFYEKWWRRKKRKKGKLGKRNWRKKSGWGNKKRFNYLRRNNGDKDRGNEEIKNIKERNNYWRSRNIDKIRSLWGSRNYSKDRWNGRLNINEKK